MTTISCNCIVCAQEFNSDELNSKVSSLVNFSAFKICQACLDACDPDDDYRQARNIVNSYLSFSEAKHLFNEASSILKEISKK